MSNFTSGDWKYRFWILEKDTELQKKTPSKVEGKLSHLLCSSNRKSQGPRTLLWQNLRGINSIICSWFLQEVAFFVVCLEEKCACKSQTARCVKKNLLEIQKSGLHLISTMHTYGFLQNVHCTASIPKFFNRTFATASNQWDLYVSLQKKKKKNQNFLIHCIETLHFSTFLIPEFAKLNNHTDCFLILLHPFTTHLQHFCSTWKAHERKDGERIHLRRWSDRTRWNGFPLTE